MLDNNRGYIMEYILSGHVNDNATDLDLANTYTKRNWDVYKKGEATEAKSITERDLVDWYKKYMEVSDPVDLTFDYTTFKKVYKTRYENLIDNYAPYWLASADSSNDIYSVQTGDAGLSDYYFGTYGVRILVTLKSDVQLLKSGVATVSDMDFQSWAGVEAYDRPYTYNVWDIQ